jgi:hypothetical protein
MSSGEGLRFLIILRGNIGEFLLLDGELVFFFRYISAFRSYRTFCMLDLLKVVAGLGGW